MSRITATLLSGTVVDLTNGRHTWSADEPIEVRGTDTGPNPYELLLSSLAACTCITLALYCRHKGLTLDSVTTSCDLTRIHAKDCEDCDDPGTGFIERIVSRVTPAEKCHLSHLPAPLPGAPSPECRVSLAPAS